MYRKISLLYLVTLALLVAGTPVPETDAAPVAFALPKRATFIKANGVFNKDAFIQKAVITKNKHRQNMINLKKNKGVKAFPKGAHIRPLAVLPAFLESLFEKRQHAEALTDTDNDLEWAGSVSIGNPPQKFTIDFDTGSSDLWVPASTCTGGPCATKHKYNSAASKTAKKQGGNFQIQYGDGSTVTGPVFTDTVTVAGVTVQNQFFSPVGSLSPSFQNDTIDGILGLAFPSISNLNQNPFFNNAKAQGRVKDSAFSFKLANVGSELMIGGVNHNLYNGAFEYHTVSSKNGFWQIAGGSFNINGKAAASNFETIIDSGTTIMYGPVDAVKQVYAQIPGSKVYDEKQGLYSFPCSSIPNVSFSWGGKQWQIKAENFNYGAVEAGSDQCVGALAGQDLGLGNNVWLLGDSFMKNVYSTFNFYRNAVGFAELK